MNSVWSASAEVLEIRQLLIANALNMIKLPQFETANPTLRGQGMSVVVIESGFDRLNPGFGVDADGNGRGDRITHSFDVYSTGSIQSKERP